MKFSKKEILIICGISLLLSFVIVLIWYGETRAPSDAVPPVSSSTPPVSGDKSDLIVVETPQPGGIVISPLMVKGKARGNWYFEASFPVILKDANGNILAQAPAQAQGEWMTTEFVPFEVTLTFTPPKFVCFRAPCTIPGTLVLKKDNPSGLPEHDDSVSIPVNISNQISTPTTQACKPTGCSGQVCSDKEVITTCEYTAAYACYKTAKCERQTNGVCGWTPTPELQACIKNPPPLN